MDSLVSQRAAKPQATRATFCRSFIEEREWYKEIRRRGEQHFKIYPQTVVDHNVVQLYHLARRPRASPPEIFSAEQTTEILDLYTKVVEASLET